jgi:peptidoglycan/xylan/chitin deacetylase (PgdA/CDA1 family)
MKKILLPFLIGPLLLAGCHSKTEKPQTEAAVIAQPAKAADAKVADAKPADPNKKANDAATILAKKEVPILCYHHIQPILSTDSAYKREYTVTPENFAAQMKALKDNGYHSILPAQLYEYLVHDAPLPDKPVMLTFDDTDGEQYTLGAKEMNKNGFKGVFFIMTVSMNRPHYMTKEQIKELSDTGHDVEAHTWDHHMVTKYAGKDFEIQLEKPKKKLEDLTGKPVNYFAYPFGVWNKASIPELKSRGYKMAFSLATKRDQDEPLYTVRRILVTGPWSTAGMLKAMDASFK